MQTDEVAPALLAASTVAVVSRIALGAVFVVAAVTKLASAGGWVPADSAIPRWLATAVPWAELAVGAALVAGLAQPWPAVAALALLAAFTLWIVARLAAGEHPRCGCFGELSARPLSWWHACRNAVLLALAVTAIAAP